MDIRGYIPMISPFYLVKSEIVDGKLVNLPPSSEIPSGFDPFRIRHAVERCQTLLATEVDLRIGFCQL